VSFNGRSVEEFINAVNDAINDERFRQLANADLLEQLLRRTVTRDVDALVQARAEGWNENLRYDYQLNEQSVVWDVGAFDGDFAHRINELYGAKIRCFEILPDKNEALVNRFEHADNVVVTGHGLGSRDRTLVGVTDAGASTSTLVRGGEVVMRVADVATALHKDKRIDLMKINIEGDEYAVLNRLIDSNRILTVKELQVQFHDVIVADGWYYPVPNAEEEYQKVRERLYRTHHLTWGWPFTWESWELNT
jgi:FkbM family methyltransferase